MKKIALITGASTGIGKETAKLLDSHGFQCLLLARSEDKLLNLQKELKEKSIVIPCDLSSQNAITSAISKIKENVEHIDLIVNNAGRYTPCKLEESSHQLWTDEFQVNLFAAHQLSFGLLELLKKNKKASIVNIASTLGIQPVPNTAIYSATKSAMISWTKSLAIELAPYGVRANCICPGIVDTPIHTFHNKSDQYKDMIDFANSLHLLGRMGKASEIAQTVLHFHEQEWATGSVFSLDGGISLK